MFTSYLQKLSGWLGSQDLLWKAEAFSAKPFDLVESPPGSERLWNSFLKTAIVDPFFNTFFSIETNTDWFSRQLLGFSSYGFQTRLKKLLEALILPCSAELLDKATAFQLLMESWITGERHQSILQNRREAVENLKETYRFDSEWAASRFLASLGYHLPTSQHAFQAWVLFSGQAESNGSYQTWLKTLSQVDDSPHQIYKLDRFLDLLFNPASQLLPTPLCQNRASCSICPLSADCTHFKQEINTVDLTNELNLIKCGNLQEFSTEELLKISLQENWNGSKKQKELLSSFPEISLKDFAKSSLEEEDKTIALLLITKELGKRMQPQAEIELGMTISNAADIYHQLSYLFSETPQEAFYELILDNKNRVIAHRLISLGTLNRSLVHPREVFAPAIQLRAAAVILVHNHPSGDPTPSPQDFSVTNRLKEVGEVVGIKVLDHIIIGRNGYHSFVDHDQL